MASVQTIADKSPWLLTRKDTMYTGIKAFSAWVDALRKSIFAGYLLKCRSGTSVGASAQRSTPAHPATLVFALMVQRTARGEVDHEMLAIWRLYNIFAQELQDDESRPREMNLQEAQDILTSRVSERAVALQQPQRSKASPTPTSAPTSLATRNFEGGEADRVLSFAQGDAKAGLGAASEARLR